MPGDVINMRRWRRNAKRSGAKAVADANAALHGLPKSVTDLAAARRAKAERELESHRLTTCAAGEEPRTPDDAGKR